MVLKELQPGYMLKGSLLRVARVVVGRYGSNENERASDPSEATTATRAPTPAPAPPRPVEPTEADDSGAWEADTSGHELEFSEDGLDFSNE
jgi:hypothetical protein